MIQLNRLDFETQQLEEKLSGQYSENHQQMIQPQGLRYIFQKSKHFRWLSASVWFKVQTTEPGAVKESLPELSKIREELLGEVRAIMSDYGTLCLEGLRLFIALMAMWLVVQNIITLRLNLWIFSSLILGCIILYPTVMYALWNGGAIHPFKAMKLIFTTLGSLAAGAGIYLWSVLEKQNPFFETVVVSTFNFTEFLILFNLTVLLSFVIHYRRVNLFSEVAANCHKHIISLSGLTLPIQEEVNGLMESLDSIPLKTHTKRRLKTKAIEKYTNSDSDDVGWVKEFIRINCIDMNGMYWTGSIAQWTIFLLLLSKLIWARDTGLVVSADYFRQELTVGMVLGALLISGFVFYPLNRCFRELLYRESPFSLKQAWLMVVLALFCITIIHFSGLVPSRFIWGNPVNPAPHPWGFGILLGLILMLQFLKSDPRLQRMGQEEK